MFVFECGEVVKVELLIINIDCSTGIMLFNEICKVYKD